MCLKGGFGLVPPVAQLGAVGGITEAAHGDLDQVIHPEPVMKLVAVGKTRHRGTVHVDADLSGQTGIAEDILDVLREGHGDYQVPRTQPPP